MYFYSICYKITQPIKVGIEESKDIRIILKIN